MKIKSFLIAAACCGLASFSRAQDMDSVAPVVVKTVPEAGAKNVPPGEYEIKVTFSKAMMGGAWSWTSAWENSQPEVMVKPHYIMPDHKTCVLTVKLEPGKTYGWWLNSGKFHGFQDAQGHPAVPYLLTFMVGTAASQPMAEINPATGLAESGSGINSAKGLTMASGPAAFKMNPTDLHAAAETWSPTVAPGEKPDLQKIRDEMKTLMAQHRYEESLQRQIWYFNHALEFGEVGPVRTSFGIMNWAELGRRYPKAKQALMEIRDGETKELAEGRGDSELFSEVLSLNRELADDDATAALFKQIYQSDKKLARECFYYAEDLLMEKGEYAMLLDCLGDPQAHFQSAQHGLEAHQRLEALRKQHPLPRMATGRFNSPDMGQMATNNFVGQMRKLVEILVATGHTADAEKIRDQAVGVVADARLKSAVADAEQKIKK